MSSETNERYDFFVSRRGSVARVAQEVVQTLEEKGYRVISQDYDIPLGASFIDKMHEAVKNARDLVILFTGDYEKSPFTRKEFTSFEADRGGSAEERHIIILRCEDVQLRGLLADNVFQDLVGVDDPIERKHRIIAAVEHRSQAAVPPTRPFVGVPPRIAGFTGRTDALDRLDAVLVQDAQAAVTQSIGRAAVQGLGGVGKTSVAVEYAHRYRKLYAGVWWCPAETRANLLTSLAGLAVMLGAASSSEGNVETAASAALRRLAEQRTTWLLVYDNVTSPEDIVDLLPSAGARVLITSRFADWSGWAEEVPLDMLAPDEAAAFLQSRAGRNDGPGAQALADAVGCLPLALDHAAATCRRTQMPFADYAAKAARLIASTPRGTPYPRSVATTFELALTQAIAQCSAAEPLMAYLGRCAPERIPMLLLDGAFDDEIDRMDAVAALAELSLIKHDPFEDDAAAVSVHRLVQAVSMAHAGINRSADNATKRLGARLLMLYPADSRSDPTLWPICAQLLPHVLAWRTAAHVDDTTVTARVDLLARAGSYLHGRAAYAQAVTLFREALMLSEEKLGADHPNVAVSLDNLARILTTQGELAGARSLLERALSIREGSLGRDHLDVAASLDRLARLLHQQNDLVGARSLYDRALTIRETSLGYDHAETADSLNNLARLPVAADDLAGVRLVCERVLANRERTLGPHHQRTATSLHNLANVLEAQAERQAAKALFERALAIRISVLGADHPDTARTRASLANLLRA